MLDMKDLFFVLIAWHPALGEKAIMSKGVQKSLLQAKKSFPLFREAGNTVRALNRMNRLLANGNDSSSGNAEAVPEVPG